LDGVCMTEASESLFPYTPRVFYKKAPLVQVICQLRFPDILRIETEVPSEFQEHIRDAFPLFDRVNPFMRQIPQELIQALGPNTSAVTYQFSTEDRSSTIELSPQWLALTTQSYKLWEGFLEQLAAPISALVGVYRPKFFTRVGLRYQDLIVRSHLGLEGRRWSDLLRPEILGELAIKGIEENAQGVSRVLHAKMPSGAGTVLLRHGFGTTPGGKEIGYVIDLDFSTEEKTEVSNVGTVLSRLHEEVGRAFRWCIRPELHDALGPSKLDPDGMDAPDRN